MNELTKRVGSNKRTSTWSVTIRQGSTRGLNSTETHRDGFFLAKEAHGDVVPERRRLGRLSRRYAVLRQRHIVVSVRLRKQNKILVDVEFVNKPLEIAVWLVIKTESLGTSTMFTVVGFLCPLFEADVPASCCRLRVWRARCSRRT